MKSVLKQMYYDVDFSTHMFEPFNVEHKRIVDEANVLEKKLTDSFNKEQFEVYDKLLSLQTESSSYYSIHTFIEGFKTVELEYMEIDGILYPNMQISNDIKYGRMRLSILKSTSRICIGCLLMVC